MTPLSLSLFPQHHCRHCGNIFCAECSARNALTPSSKKPVRVCDGCFDELQGWWPPPHTHKPVPCSPRRPTYPDLSLIRWATRRGQLRAAGTTEEQHVAVVTWCWKSDQNWPARMAVLICPVPLPLTGPLSDPEELKGRDRLRRWITCNIKISSLHMFYAKVQQLWHSGLRFTSISSFRKI